MLKSGKFVAGIGVLALCLILIATFALTAPAAKQAPAQAAQAAQATPTISNTVPVTSGATTPISTTNPTKPGDKQSNPGVDTGQYMAAFNQTFAAKLGVSEAALNTAFSAAVSDTADQMAKDGKIDANQAAKLKEAAHKGPGSVLPLIDAKAKAGGSGPLENPKALTQGALAAAAKLFNRSLDELNTKLQNGQSLADLAAAAKIDLQKVKAAMFASIKAQLDALVKSGSITQTDSDNIQKKMQAFVEDFVSARGQTKPNGGIYDRLLGDPTWEAAAQLLNLPVNSLKDQVKKGQSIFEIAQSQKVDLAKLKDGLQNSMKGQLDSLVKSGTITQAAADQTLKDLPNLITKFIGG